MLAACSTSASARGSCRPFTASARPPAVPAGRACLVVVAVKPTKANDFRGLSDAELVQKANSLKRELATVRFLQKTRGIVEVKPGQQMEQPDPSKVPKGNMNAHIGRQIAQLWTILRERALKDGITRRQYAKMMKSASLKAGIQPLY